MPIQTLLSPFTQCCLSFVAFSLYRAVAAAARPPMTKMMKMMSNPKLASSSLTEKAMSAEEPKAPLGGGGGGWKSRPQDGPAPAPQYAPNSSLSPDESKHQLPLRMAQLGDGSQLGYRSGQVQLPPETRPPVVVAGGGGGGVRVRVRV